MVQYDFNFTDIFAITTVAMIGTYVQNYVIIIPSAWNRNPWDEKRLTMYERKTDKYLYRYGSIPVTYSLKRITYIRIILPYRKYVDQEAQNTLNATLDSWNFEFLMNVQYAFASMSVTALYQCRHARHLPEIFRALHISNYNELFIIRL